MTQPTSRTLPSPSAAAPRGVGEPLLTGTLAERADDALRAIAAAECPETSSSDRYSIPGGTGGRALFHAYLGAEWGSEKHEVEAVELLRQSVAGVSLRWNTAGLHGGFSGVGFTVEHLKGSLLDPDEDLGTQGIDEALCAALAHTREQGLPWAEGYDLISGLVGLGVYALERLPAASARSCLELVVEGLAAMASEEPAGTTWFTTPAMIPRTQKEDYPDGYYNFGVAHGIPGVIALLGRVQAEGIARPTTERLLSGGVAWLLAHENPPDAPSRFPTFLAPGVSMGTSRLGWCYGDPGVAAALLCAARAVGERAWEREALRVALDAAKRPVQEHGLVDGGLCHGTAGLAHVFGRMHRLSGKEALRDAALAYYERTLELRQPGTGVAGFRSWGPGEDTELQWLDDSGFLTGTAGIGLALLAGLSSTEPAWDRVLLLSHPGLCSR